MKACVICGETYPQELRECPFCGCPDDRFSFEKLGYPARLDGLYRIVRLRENGPEDFDILAESGTDGTFSVFSRLPSEEEEAFLEILDKQKRRNIADLPSVLEICREEGWYRCEAVKGQSMKELQEGDNLQEDLTEEDCREELDRIRNSLQKAGIDCGRISAGDYTLSEEGIRLKGFGPLIHREEEEIELPDPPEPEKQTGFAGAGGSFGENRTVWILAGVALVLVIAALLILLLTRFM